MIQIRKGCFETNSSSTHTLVISKEMPTNFPETVSLSIGEFGWEQEKYDTIDARASYFYTAACALYGYDVKRDVEKLLAPYGVRINFSWDNINPVFCVYEKGGQAYLDNGYIDHDMELQSFVDRCFNEPDYLVRWLFGTTSRLYTGNDNTDDDREFGIDEATEEVYEKWN